MDPNSQHSSMNDNSSWMINSPFFVDTHSPIEPPTPQQQPQLISNFNHNVGFQVNQQQQPDFFPIDLLEDESHQQNQEIIDNPNQNLGFQVNQQMQLGFFPNDVQDQTQNAPLQYVQFPASQVQHRQQLNQFHNSGLPLQGRPQHPLGILPPPSANQDWNLQSQYEGNGDYIGIADPASGNFGGLTTPPGGNLSVVTIPYGGNSGGLVNPLGSHYPAATVPSDGNYDGLINPSVGNYNGAIIPSGDDYTGQTAILEDFVRREGRDPNQVQYNQQGGLDLVPHAGHNQQIDNWWMLNQDGNLFQTDLYTGESLNNQSLVPVADNSLVMIVPAGNNQGNAVNIGGMEPVVQRTSAFRGVTKHRWTGRYEAHLWDNSYRREGQTRKGRQVYLGGYDTEEKAARAYDLVALKYWGSKIMTNFPINRYGRELREMSTMTRQEYVASIRRKSSGFSRGASIYRGVTRHHQNGKWQARIGRVAGNKDLYLGTYKTQEEAAEAYDIAAIRFKGLNAVTNFEMSRYDVNAILRSKTWPIGEAGRYLRDAMVLTPLPLPPAQQTTDQQTEPVDASYFQMNGQQQPMQNNSPQIYGGNLSMYQQGWNPLVGFQQPFPTNVARTDEQFQNVNVIPTAPHSELPSQPMSPTPVGDGALQANGNVVVDNVLVSPAGGDDYEQGAEFIGGQLTEEPQAGEQFPGVSESWWAGNDDNAGGQTRVEERSSWEDDTLT